MGVGAGLYMYVVVVQKFTFAISSPGEFLSPSVNIIHSLFPHLTKFPFIHHCHIPSITHPRLKIRLFHKSFPVPLHHILLRWQCILPHHFTAFHGLLPWPYLLSKSVFNLVLFLIMVALCNRADHYIFILFLSFFFFFFFLFFPRLISAVGDWMSTILRHMVWS